MTDDASVKRCQRLLIGHGALLIFAGGVIGFGFLFNIVGEISLWPIPGAIHYQMPGDYAAWHMAHLEALLNAAVIWLLAATLPLLPFTSAGLRRISLGMIVVAWTIVGASTIKPFFRDSRGLVPSGLLSNNVVFGLFYVGIALLMVIMPIIAVKSFRAASR